MRAGAMFSRSSQSYSTPPPTSSRSSSSLLFSNPPSYLKYQECQFIIMDAPNDANLSLYLKELSSHKVKTLVRVCEPSYSEERVDEEGMQVIGMEFPDGYPPSQAITCEWLKICHNEIIQHRRPVAVHCVAGLGRSPVLVAIALMEMTGIASDEAVRLIRGSRRGAINQRQCNFLRKYQLRSHHDCVDACVIL